MFWPRKRFIGVWTIYRTPESYLICADTYINTIVQLILLTPGSEILDRNMHHFTM